MKVGKYLKKWIIISGFQRYWSYLIFKEFFEKVHLQALQKISNSLFIQLEIRFLQWWLHCRNWESRLINLFLIYFWKSMHIVPIRYICNARPTKKIWRHGENRKKPLLTLDCWEIHVSILVYDWLGFYILASKWGCGNQEPKHNDIQPCTAGQLLVQADQEIG